jgi:hypothetical protein
VSEPLEAGPRTDPDEALREAVHDFFEADRTESEDEYGPGCIHFDKGFGLYRLCDDPDQGVPIRGLPAILATLREQTAIEARPELDVFEVWPSSDCTYVGLHDHRVEGGYVGPWEGPHTAEETTDD